MLSETPNEKASPARSPYAPALFFSLRLVLHAAYVVLAAVAASYVTFKYVVPEVGDNPGAAVLAPPIFLAVYLACLCGEALVLKGYGKRPFLGTLIRSSVAFLIAAVALLALMISTNLVAVVWPLALLPIFLAIEVAADALLQSAIIGVTRLRSRRRS